MSVSYSNGNARERHNAIGPPQDEKIARDQQESPRGPSPLQMSGGGQTRHACLMSIDWEQLEVLRTSV